MGECGACVHAGRRGLGRSGSQGWPGMGQPGWMPEPVELGRPGSGGWPSVGRLGWVPDPIELGSLGSAGVPGVGRSDERPELELWRMAAGLHLYQLDLCLVGAGPVSVLGWPRLGDVTECFPLGSVEQFPWRGVRCWRSDLDEGWD